MCLRSRSLSGVMCHRACSVCVVVVCRVACIEYECVNCVCVACWYDMLCVVLVNCVPPCCVVCGLVVICSDVCWFDVWCCWVRLLRCVLMWFDYCVASCCVCGCFRLVCVVVFAMLWYGVMLVLVRVWVCWGGGMLWMLVVCMMRRAWCVMALCMLM